MGEESLYLKDTNLPFGSRLAPLIFHRLTESVRRMMARKGFPYIVAYLDDFLIIAPSLDECQAALDILLRLLRKLGFQINWQVVDPTRSLDTIGMTMCIPYSKLMQIKEELALFSTRRRAIKRQLQSLIGLLNWAASVVFGGRVFLHRLMDVLRTLNGKKDRVRLSAEILKDIHWWITYINNFNGKSVVLDNKPITCVYTDACNTGGGAVFGSDWVYCNWRQHWPATTKRLWQ